MTIYLFQGRRYCEACIIPALPTLPGEMFDGWEDVSDPPMPVEVNLDELAAAFGIDRATVSDVRFPVRLASSAERPDCHTPPV